MRKSTLPVWAHGVLSLCGLVLVASMFVSWIEVEGIDHITGLGLAWDVEPWLFVVPLAGAALLAAAATRAQATRLAAIGAGIVVSGYVLFHLTKSALFDGGADTWLIFGGAGLVLAGASSTRRSWRAIGGLAVLVGFFAPWEHVSTFAALRSDAVVLADRLDVTVRVLWLIPLAGLAAIGSALWSSARSGSLAVVAGVTVLGSILWTLGSLLNVFLAWGAWAAMGASTIALVVGVLAPGRAAAPTRA